MTDTGAAEVDATKAKGFYVFDLAQGETNGECLLYSAKSATANIEVRAVPDVIYTKGFDVAGLWTALGITAADLNTRLREIYNKI